MKPLRPQNRIHLNVERPILAKESLETESCRCTISSGLNCHQHLLLGFSFNHHQVQGLRMRGAIPSIPPIRLRGMVII